MTPTIRYNLRFTLEDRHLTKIEDTNIDINDYTAEVAQCLTHLDFFIAIVGLLAIKLAMTLRHHIPQDHLAYDLQCHHRQHLLHAPKSSPDKEGSKEEGDIDDTIAYHNTVIIQQKDEREQLLLESDHLRELLAEALLHQQGLEEQLAEYHLQHHHRQAAENSTSPTLIEQRDQGLQKTQIYHNIAIKQLDQINLNNFNIKRLK